MRSPYLNPFQKFQQTEQTLEEKQKLLESISGIEPETKKGLPKHTIIGCGGCAVLIIIFMAGILAFTSIVVEQTWFIAGDTSKYDPIASFAETAARAGTDAKLVKMEARLVKSDGTLDLNADYKPAPQVEFTFYREVPAPQNAPPPGAVSGNNGTWYETIRLKAHRPWQSSSVRSFSGSGSSSYQYVNLGMEKDVGTPVSYLPGTATPPPACPFQKLWTTAIQKGAPQNAVSTITYDSNGYLFEMNLEKPLLLKFDFKCQLITN